MAVVKVAAPPTWLPWLKILFDAAFRPTIGHYQQIALDPKANIVNGILLQVICGLGYDRLTRWVQGISIFQELSVFVSIFLPPVLLATLLILLTAGLLHILLGKFRDLQSFGRMFFLVTAGCLPLYLLGPFRRLFWWNTLIWVGSPYLFTGYCFFVCVLTLKVVYQRSWKRTIVWYGLVFWGSILLTKHAFFPGYLFIRELFLYM